MMNKYYSDAMDIHVNRFQYLKEFSRPKIGWLSIYTPIEIIHAAGAIPYRITGETVSGTVKASGYMHRNICPYILSCFEEVLGNAHDFSDGAIIVNACDGRRRLFDVWQYYNPNSMNLFFLDLPKAVNPPSKLYFKKQVIRLIEFLEKTYNCRIDDEKISASISLFNQTRLLLQRMYQLRKQDTPPITSMQALSLVKASQTGLNHRFNEALSNMLEHIDPDNAIKTPEHQNHENPRLLICGSYFDHIEILELLERLNATVVCEDISNGIKFFEGIVDEKGDPLYGLSEYYLDKATCARMIDSEKRAGHLLDLVKEYKADAVIYVSLKFCDNNLMDFAYQKNKLKQNDIPVLFLEIERTMTNMEQIKTRIQTFVDTLSFR